MAKRLPHWNRWPVLVTEVIGLGLAGYLTLLTFGLIGGGHVPCPRGTIFACESVVRGPWSRLGPLPFSLLGTLYFAASLALTLLSGKSRLVQWAKLGLVFSGIFVVAWLRAVEILALQKICPWCLAVALATLTQAVLHYPGFTPPLPKAAWPGRFAAVLGTFAVLLAAMIAGGMVRSPGASRVASDDDLIATAPAPTATPLPAPRHAPAAEPARLPSGTPRPTPTPRPAPEPTPAEVAAPAVPDNDETRILRRRGWKLIGDSRSITQALRSQPPVLLYTYDEHCETCKALVRGGLDGTELDDLPITRLAIEQAMLTGRISDQVPNVPSLLLITGTGQIIFRHEGMMSGDRIRAEVEAALARQ